MTRRPWLVSLMALGIMLVLGAALGRIQSFQRLGQPGLTVELPAEVAGYPSKPLAISREELEGLPRDTTFGRRLYYLVEQGQTNYLQASVVLMGSDRTSIHKPQFCLTGQGWHIAKTERVSIPVDKPVPYDLPAIRLTTAVRDVPLDNGQSVQARGIYVYWFVADGQITAEHWQRMWWMARELLTTGTLQRWAYVSCFAACFPGDEQRVYGLIQRWIEAAVPQFQHAAGPPTRALKAEK